VANFQVPSSQGHYDYTALERVMWGLPAAQAIAETADRLDKNRVFVLAARSLSRTTNVVEGILSALGPRFAGLFDACKEHSPFDSIVEAAAAAREADPDLIVSVGGGSVVDAGKVVLVCLRENLFTVDALIERTRETETPSELRQIAVPTTLSGAEFTNIAGGTNPRTRTKSMIAGKNLCPHTVILDPATCLHTPERLWFATAIRSVDHAAEGYCAKATNPLIQAQALRALQLFSTSLRATKLDPADLEARLQSQHAVWLATASLGRVSMGASHGLGYLLGTLGGVPHGETSCVFLPSVLKWNAPETAQAQKDIAQALGAPGLSASDAIGRLLDDLGLPRRLRDVGANRDLVDKIADHALSHPVVLANPRPITCREDVMEILEMAW